jgi:hypothetical protein
MNSIFHIPTHVKITSAEARLAEGRRTIPEQYVLDVTYKPEEPAVRFRSVHIPARLLEALKKPASVGFHMIALDIGSREAQTLAVEVGGELVAPDYLVMGVEVAQGREVSEVPAAWARYRRNDLLLAWLHVVTAASLLASNVNVAFNAAAALLLAMGISSFGRVKRIHTKPFGISLYWSK